MQNHETSSLFRKYCRVAKNSLRALLISCLVVRDRPRRGRAGCVLVLWGRFCCLKKGSNFPCRRMKLCYLNCQRRQNGSTFHNVFFQYSGSRSTGSTCFWASRIRILLSSSKNSKKNLDSYCFVTSFGLLSLKMMLMYLQNVISRKTRLKKWVFCWFLEGQWRK